MRIGEAHALEWQDVDVSGSRFRVRHGKTAAASRFVAVPAALMDEIAAATPPDDRTPERRVLGGFTPDTARNVMRKACNSAGVAHFHPHDLRHRYASVKIAEGVPVTQVRGATRTRPQQPHAGHVFARFDGRLSRPCAAPGEAWSLAGATTSLQIGVWAVYNL